jgi:hypothetical protein
MPPSAPDRIRLTGLLRETPAKAGVFYFRLGLRRFAILKGSRAAHAIAAPVLLEARSRLSHRSMCRRATTSSTRRPSSTTSPRCAQWSVSLTVALTPPPLASAPPGLLGSTDHGPAGHGNLRRSLDGFARVRGAVRQRERRASARPSADRGQGRHDPLTSARIAASFGDDEAVEIATTSERPELIEPGWERTPRACLYRP